MGPPSLCERPRMAGRRARCHLHGLQTTDRLRRLGPRIASRLTVGPLFLYTGIIPEGKFPRRPERCVAASRAAGDRAWLRRPRPAPCHRSRARARAAGPAAMSKPQPPSRRPRPESLTPPPTPPPPPCAARASAARTPPPASPPPRPPSSWRGRPASRASGRKIRWDMLGNKKIMSG